jgi:putative molybdopterin biosynthesis protein
VAEQERLLSARLAALAGEARPGVRLALSHDPLLLDALSDMPDIVASVVGSHEAVALLRSGGTDAAGFHAGALRISSPPFDRLVEDPAYVVTPLFTREQGLMVAPGNPLSIHAVEDLARTGARFVNRQRGSGTRAWFDRLLAEARIPTAAVTGYDVEEFTHQAVAAVVAAGAADAGMGVRSVAERFGLAFAPIGQETYCLAERRDAACPVADRIRDRVRALVRRMPGYGPAAGTGPARGEDGRLDRSRSRPVRRGRTGAAAGAPH